MAVLSVREILPRNLTHKMGGSPEASCVWSATLDGPTNTSLILANIGIVHGTPHPEYSALTCDGYTLDETDRHHATITYTYSVKDPKDPEDPSQPPWLQPDKWAFSTTSSSVACTEYYPEPQPNLNFINVAWPLVNTAGDVIIGVSKAESELKITISGSRLQFDLATFRKLVNTINSGTWAGFPKHTVQCVGVSAQPDRIEWEGQAVNFWQINIELVYRSSTHNIFLPNVGWNVNVNGKKERAWVYITDGGQRKKVPSPHPVSLNKDGGFLCGQDQADGKNWTGGTSLADDGTDYYGS